MRTILLISLIACNGADEPSSTPPNESSTTIPRGAEPAGEGHAQLRRLTQAEYAHSIEDLLGAGLIVPTQLEPDELAGGMASIGAGSTALSPLGVEQYEDAAYLIAAQVAADTTRFASLYDCAPQETGCYEAVAAQAGRLAWRRSLTTSEVSALVSVASAAEDALGTPEEGAEFLLAAILMSPHFVYRVESGPSDIDWASRVAFFLWAGPPDKELLDAAEDGSLDRAAAVDRMLADPRARRGIRAFFTQMLELDELEHLTKDPATFLHYSDLVGPSAKEETLLGIEHLIFTEDGDYRELLTTQTTFVDRTLAAIYEVPAPTREGFGQVELPEELGRRGLLGQVSVLAAHAHPVSTSVTRRGHFVQSRLLCNVIPPPPADVDTSIPEPSEDAKTMRERVAIHLESELCAGCHSITDPIGLGLENFDGIGRWRTTENGATIDASGELDGGVFADGWELGEAVAEHESLPWCLARTAYGYGVGNAPISGDNELVEWYDAGFRNSDHNVLALFRELALSQAFGGMP